MREMSKFGEISNILYVRSFRGNFVKVVCYDIILASKNWEKNKFRHLLREL